MFGKSARFEGSNMRCKKLTSSSMEDPDQRELRRRDASAIGVRVRSVCVCARVFASASACEYTCVCVSVCLRASKCEYDRHASTRECVWVRVCASAFARVYEEASVGVFISTYCVGKCMRAWAREYLFQRLRYCS